MYAIIETGGKQIKVEDNSVIWVEKLDAQEGETVEFDKVLYVDGKIGTPFVEGAKVTGVVEKQGKGKKITIVKYRPKNPPLAENRDIVSLIHGLKSNPLLLKA